MRLALFIGFVAYAASGILHAQEITTQNEMRAYLPETVPADLIEIYNKEVLSAGYLPRMEYTGVEKLSMESKFTAEDKTRIRKAEYDKHAGTLLIEMEGQNIISKQLYTLKNGVMTKVVSRFEMKGNVRGPEKFMMKDIRVSDPQGRLMKEESFYHSDTGWVQMKKTSITYQNMKDGLLLEIRKNGEDALSTTDSVWYYFGKNGMLLKKSSMFERWGFTYTDLGEISEVLNAKRNFSAETEDVFYTKYYYEKAEGKLKGKLMLKQTDGLYYNTALRFNYSDDGKMVLKTVVKTGDNEVKEINSFTWGPDGKLQAVGQTLDGTPVFTGIVTCDAAGNIKAISGNQSPAKTTIQYKNGMGSSGFSIEGPGKVETTVTTIYNKP